MWKLKRRCLAFKHLEYRQEVKNPTQDVIGRCSEQKVTVRLSQVLVKEDLSHARYLNPFSVFRYQVYALVCRSTQKICARYVHE